jgi:hypothetical protein
MCAIVDGMNVRDGRVHNPPRGETPRRAKNCWSFVAVTTSRCPRALATKTILGVVVGYSLDEARQHFLGRWFWLWTHADYPGPASRPLKTPKMCCVGISARASVGYLFAHRCPVQILWQSPAQRA